MEKCCHEHLLRVKCNYLNHYCDTNMNIDLEDLKAFVATAEMQSFRAASESIHLSQPALTRRIQKLEAENTMLRWENDVLKKWQRFLAETHQTDIDSSRGTGSSE